MSFQCIFTGKPFSLDEHNRSREGGVAFGNNSRFRAVAYVLTTCLFGRPRIIADLTQEEAKHIRGIGMSDSQSYASMLASVFDYTNTFYHQEPFLDIQNPNPLFHDLDFIISSDVMEHVSPYPSLQQAFDNLFRMLRPGGWLILSVPFNAKGDHREHFPDLFEYTIILEGGEWRLRNTTVDGRQQEFRNLCFHGGPGAVLEMRVFSRSSLEAFLSASGFIEITFFAIDEDMQRYGIFWDGPNDANSLVLSARRPF